MAARIFRFELRLSREELNELKEKADRAGISKADFVRKVVAGKELCEAPPVDVPLLIREVRRVGSNIDQILKFANTRGYMDIGDLRKALADNREVEKLISRAYGVAWQ